MNNLAPTSRHWKEGSKLKQHKHKGGNHREQKPMKFKTQKE